MQHDLTYIVEFIINNFLHIWPYMLFSIPLAVAVNMSNAKQYIRKAFGRNALVSILLATLVGAFSPFCSCSVIPLIASLLIAGVPLGPVMAFWIASPTMDPEIFLLSVGVLGWDLAVARVVATLILSLTAGYVAHTLEQRHFFVNGILREQKRAINWSWRRLGQTAIRALTNAAARISGQKQMPVTASASLAAGSAPIPTGSLITIGSIGLASGPIPATNNASCGSTSEPAASDCGSTCGTTPAASDCGSTCSTATVPVSKWQQARQETLNATIMIVKFMIIAFLLEALINLYVPQDTIVKLVGTGNPLAILLSALIGVPIYTSNLTALPLVGGLLDQGMLPGAALAFLIAGPATTIPAMSAVYGIAKPRVFVVYAGITLIGAVVLGFSYQLLLGWT